MVIPVRFIPAQYWGCLHLGGKISENILLTIDYSDLQSWTNSTLPHFLKFLKYNFCKKKTASRSLTRSLLYFLSVVGITLVFVISLNKIELWLCSAGHRTNISGPHPHNANQSVLTQNSQQWRPNLQGQHLQGYQHLLEPIRDGYKWTLTNRAGLGRRDESPWDNICNDVSNQSVGVPPSHQHDTLQRDRAAKWRLSMVIMLWCNPIYFSVNK